MIDYRRDDFISRHFTDDFRLRLHFLHERHAGVSAIADILRAPAQRRRRPATGTLHRAVRKSHSFLEVTREFIAMISGDSTLVSIPEAR